MSVRHSLLVILGHGPCYGHQLRQEFDRRTGGTWSINAGQVYQTLDRLARDKLVETAGVDAEGRELYAITPAGRAEAAAWLQSPVLRLERDELAIKLALAVTLPDLDAEAVIEAQRTASRAALAIATAASAGDLGEAVVLASMVASAEADLRWLDEVERLLGSSAPYGLNAEAPRKGRPTKSSPAVP